MTREACLFILLRQKAKLEREARRAYLINWRKANPKKAREQNKRSNGKRNPQRLCEAATEYYWKNRQEILAQKTVERRANPEKYIARARKNYAENSERCIRTVVECTRRRLKVDPVFRLERNMRSRLNKAIVGQGKKSAATFELIGCSVDFLRGHLEKLFLPGMSWENYGIGGWHVDHKRPCSWFNLSIPSEQQKCCHYLNLQPKWEKDNLEKGDKWKDL